MKRLLQDDIPSVPKSSYADELKHTAEVSSCVCALCLISVTRAACDDSCRSKRCFWLVIKHTRFESTTRGAMKRREERLFICSVRRVNPRQSLQRRKHEGNTATTELWWLLSGAPVARGSDHLVVQ